MNWIIPFKLVRVFKKNITTLYLVFCEIWIDFSGSMAWTNELIVFVRLPYYGKCSQINGKGQSHNHQSCNIFDTAKWMHWFASKIYRTSMPRKNITIILLYRIWFEVCMIPEKNCQLLNFRFLGCLRHTFGGMVQLHFFRKPCLRKIRKKICCLS